jgi:hypothetical protein
MADEAHLKRDFDGSPQQWIWMRGTTGEQWHVD